MLIGEIVGDVSTDSFTFEAYKDVKKFDFVTVKNPKEGKEWILAQIDSVTKSPEGKIEAEANIIGYREKGMLKQPRHVIKPDSMVYRADEGVIAETLGLRQDGLYMGRLETNPDIRIFVNPSDLYKHIAVLAQTGAGKSYATGVMLEELLEQDYPVVVIDPHGEYHSLAHPNDELAEEAKDKFGIDPQGYDCTEYSTDTDINTGAERLAFSSKNLDAKELDQLIPTNLTNSQLEVLYNALKELKDRDEYTLDDIIDKCMNQDSKAKWNLVNVLEIVQDSNLFADNPTNTDELVQRGHASIINLKGVDPENQEMVVYKLAKELFNKRKVGGLDPFIMIMEEAHNFVPESNLGKAVCSDMLRTIASEGRKFGMGIGVISQRPANVNKNILSQCNTQLILRVTNPNDLKAISRSFEGVTKEVEKSITSLPPGTGLVLGKEYPVMTNIRARRSQHGGTTQELADPNEQQHGRNPDTAEDHDDAAETAAASPSTSTPVQDAEQVAADTAEAAVEQSSSAPAEPATGQSPSSAQTVHQEQDQTTETADATETSDREDEADDTDASTLTAIPPAVDPGRLRDEFGSVKTAYYPLWIVSSGDERIAVDATDGEIKARDKLLNSVEEQVLAEIKEGDKTRGNLLEALDISLTKLQRTLDSLQDKSLVVEENDMYAFNGVDVLDRDTESVDAEGVTEISTDISEGNAIKIAKQELSSAPNDIEKIYYPYFTAGKRVFDGVIGEEI